MALGGGCRQVGSPSRRRLLRVQAGTHPSSGDRLVCAVVGIDRGGMARLEEFTPGASVKGMEPPRWHIITPSQYEHERRALDFIRAGLPDHDPYRAWSNFEFQTSDGAIYEVDLLVLTKQGFWLAEIKSWPGRVAGDAGTWTRTHEGRTVSEDNPVLLANRKAKALSSLLKRQKSAFSKVQVPWLDAVVFLSAEDVQCDLAGAGETACCSGTDRRRGIAQSATESSKP